MTPDVPAKGSGPNGELVEGVDYSIDSETGFLIFTELFLLNRGYCCESGCLNCPYGYSSPVVKKTPT